MLDVRRLRLLRELALRGTLAEVAEALSFSPSSVSQQLSVLEKEAGVELLRKVGRRVQLTPQAEILVARTAELLDVLERAEADLAASLSTVTGTVRVAVFQSAALALLPGALSGMRLRYPEVRVEMAQTEPERALYETWIREFDLVVAEQYPGHAAAHHPDLDRRELVADAIRLAVPPEGPWSGITTLEQARELPWVMEPRGAASRHWDEQLCRRAGFEPDVRYETADLQAQTRLVASGHAVALMPDLMWTAAPSPCRLLALPGGPRRTVFTSVRGSSARRPAILAVRQALEEVAAELSARMEPGAPA
ncbi:LysR family transcriptional regulator [Kocuria flava]|uniref:LysR family transcriptional regulator n=1 Tax=Kocuria flava TaxID=446860 RepID=UPI003F1B8A3F